MENIEDDFVSTIEPGQECLPDIDVASDSSREEPPAPVPAQRPPLSPFLRKKVPTPLVPKAQPTPATTPSTIFDDVDDEVEPTVIHVGMPKTGTVQDVLDRAISKGMEAANSGGLTAPAAKSVGLPPRVSPPKRPLPPPPKKQEAMETPKAPPQPPRPRGLTSSPPVQPEAAAVADPAEDPGTTEVTPIETIQPDPQDKAGTEPMAVSNDKADSAIAEGEPQVDEEEPAAVAPVSPLGQIDEPSTSGDSQEAQGDSTDKDVQGEVATAGPSTANPETKALPQGAADPQMPSELTLGVLFEGRDMRIVQEADALLIWLPGATEAIRLPIRLSAPDGTSWARGRYVLVNRNDVERHPALFALLQSGYDFDGNKNRNMAVHQIVAILAHGARLFAADGTPTPQVHHLNLNSLDNMADNLRTVSTTTHNALHAHVDRMSKEDREDFLASIGCARCSPDGLGSLPDNLRAMFAADAARFEDREQSEAEGESDTDSNQEAYNPPVTLLRLLDLSLDFSRGFMAVSGTLPEIREMQEEVEKDGKKVRTAKVDEWGRKVFVPLWAPHTLTDRHVWVRPGDPLPEELQPYVSFELEGLEDEARWSHKGMAAFFHGKPPVPDLAERIQVAIASVVGFARPVDLWLVVVYIALTYVFLLARRCPFLALQSAMPGAGKTTLLEVMSRLAFNAYRIGGSSKAVIPRLVDRAKCTLLLDEAEGLATAKGGGSLIEILNARADLGNGYTVTVGSGENMRPQTFDLFGPTVIANLGGLAPTLMTRSLTIEMVALGTEDGDKHVISVAEAANWSWLRDQLYLWARAYWREVKNTHDNDPNVRVGSNRHADLWRLLLAVSKHFAGDAVFETLRAEAANTATLGHKDDIVDAMAFAVWNWANSPTGGTSIMLSALLGQAQGLVEADQRKYLHSKKLSGFCRNLRLSVGRSTAGPTEVRVTNKKQLKGDLQSRFPHLFPSP